MLSISSGPRRRLWERRRADPDYLLLRVGTADLPSTVESTDPTQDEHRRRRFWLIPDAPVTVPLAERGVAGIAGPGDVPRSAGRWLVAQIAALHSPEDVRVCVLTGAEGQAAWEWVRWLPHCRPAQCWPAEGQNCAVLVGAGAETVAARIAELQAIITARGKALREHGVAEGRFGHDIVVVFDGSRKLRSLPGAIGVLREGPRVGVYSICLDAEERLLPAECQAVAAAGPDGRLAVRQASQPAIGGVRPEYVTSAWADQVARSIAPIRDVSGDEDPAGLPGSCRLLDILGAEPPAAGAIAAGWQAGGRSTHAVIGACYDGPFGIDLSKDGPHALIAGTTGAGKSELLQTLIASLALVNRPDAMTFVLVDYKGGSAFKDCVHLPHVTGMVTDLDPHLTQRALASLSAELTGREKMLAAAGAKDIEEYTERAGRVPRSGPLPRLVIVIDEFASLGLAAAGTETQVALLAPDPSGQAQAAALRQVAGWADALLDDPLVPGRRRPGDPGDTAALAAALPGLAPRRRRRVRPVRPGQGRAPHGADGPQRSRRCRDRRRGPAASPPLRPSRRATSSASASRTAALAIRPGPAPRR